MRDTIARLVEQAECLGAVGSQQELAGWFKGAVIGLYVEFDRSVQFGESETMLIVFHLLEEEKLIERNPDFKGRVVLGQPAYVLTAAGRYLAEQSYLEWVRTQTKH